MTDAVGSMWCAYVFTAIALISLPAAIATGNLITIINWIAQTFLQLVLLSIILKGQNIQGERVETVISRIDKNSKETEKTIEYLKTIVNKLESQQKEELKELEKK